MKTIITVAILALTLSGCASIVNGKQQTVTVNTLDDISDRTRCTATNKEGTWSFIPGEAFKVRRSSDSLSVTCQNEQQKTNKVIKPERQSRFYVADFFIWDLCLISCWIDTGNGSIYEYPTQVEMMMDYKPQLRAEQ